MSCMKRWARGILLASLILPLVGCGFAQQKHLRPISSALQKRLEERGLDSTAPILIRIFKKSSVLEIWKSGEDGYYKLLAVYPICNWSGNLGPKKAEGDYQAPEGFYMVTSSQMNPKSKYYLSFDLGFPNKLDTALGWYGSYLMVHGSCTSAGCYAMTDEIIADIYGLARDSFEAGQDVIQVHIFPFRMTEENLREYKGHSEYEFWLNLKKGYDFFEERRLPPGIGVCGGRYVFGPTRTETVMEGDDPFLPCQAHQNPPTSEGEGVALSHDSPPVPVLL